jgi:hypothetical protein
MSPDSAVLKFAAATRKDMKVVKKPIASCMTLVATMSVLICVRIESLGCIDPHEEKSLVPLNTSAGTV